MRFYSPRTTASSFLFIFLFGAFIGWKSGLYFEGQKNAADTLSEVSSSNAGSSETRSPNNPLDLDLFWQVYAEVSDNYVDVTAVDSEKQLYGAIKGMVKSLGDPYTEFMDPTTAIEFQQALDGTLKGIGAELTIQEGALVVIAPLKGSPAEKAGLKPDDVIYMIDDQYAADLSLFEAIMSIRGEEGSTVKLTLLRDGVNEPLVKEITRAEIKVPDVELSYVGANEDIAYIDLYQFTETTTDEFDEAVQSILLRDVQGIVLDLRYNGGGYLDAAVDILSDFLEGKKKATLTKHRNEDANEIFYTNESARLAHLPLVVLVNAGSASASEILAGAIQDYERGLIIGEQTFGKGSVQIVESFEDGSSLRLTIAKWYTPNERSIDDVGITPDQIVEITEEDLANNIDSQKEAAIRYLEGTDSVAL